MSHFSTVKTELRDRQALVDALTDLGMTPQQGELQIRGYKGQMELAHLSVAQANGSDIGFRFNPDRSAYELVTDLQMWDQQVPVERFLAKLNQRYALHSILATSAQEGFQVSEQTNHQDGSIELVVTRWQN